MTKWEDLEKELLADPDTKREFDKLDHKQNSASASNYKKIQHFHTLHQNTKLSIFHKSKN